MTQAQDKEQEQQQGLQADKAAREKAAASAEQKAQAADGPVDAAELTAGDGIAAPAAEPAEMTEPSGAEADAALPASSEPASHGPKPKKHKLRTALIAIAALLLVIACVVGFLFWKGVLAPGGAAAKYDGMNYISEQEVSDYIDDYKKMMNLGDADEETWAIFLASYNLTPERLRISTIQQLVTDAMVRSIAQKDGLEVSSDELDSYVQTMKNNTAFGSDKIWEETLEQAGTTEEKVRASYELQLLQQKVYKQEVETPTPTDDEVKSYLEGMVQTEGRQSIKHIYYFAMSNGDSGSASKDVQKVRKELMSGELTQERFEALVAQCCNVDDVKNTNGAYGWSIDMDDKSSALQEAVTNAKSGQVSEVFADDDAYGFVWIDQTYKLPKQSKISSMDLAQIPDTLLSYFKDSTAYSLWRQNCTTWLADLISGANIVYYDMPSDAPYNVDMSLAQTSDDSSSSESADDGAGDSADEGSSDDASSSSAGGSNSSGSSDAASSEEGSE